MGSDINSPTDSNDGLGDKLKGMLSGLVGGAKNIAGSDAVGTIAGKTNNWGQTGLFFMGAFDGKDENGNVTHGAAETVNSVANFAKVAESFNKYLNNQKTGVQTVGDMAEALVGYANFKDDLDNGDGVMWAATKTFVLSKVAGFLAEKFASGIYNSSTTIQSAVAGMKGSTPSSEHGLSPSPIVARAPGAAVAH